MKIQLEYNPNTSETQLLINGVADRSMYNPFFQVNGYPLQSWLKKRLAWAGLAETVGSLARGSSVEFVCLLVRPFPGQIPEENHSILRRKLL